MHGGHLLQADEFFLTVRDPVWSSASDVGGRFAISARQYRTAMEKPGRS
jgi:hypothetical protein